MHKLYAFIIITLISFTAITGYLYLSKTETNETTAPQQKIAAAVDKVEGNYKTALLRHTTLSPTFDEKEYTLTNTETIPTDDSVSVASFEIETDSGVIDVIFDKPKKTIFVKGLKPAEMVSLSNNQATRHKNLPVDWSGKIELAMNIASQNNYCLETSKSALKVCHAFNNNLNIGGKSNE